jgi:hypothetical protein
VLRNVTGGKANVRHSAKFSIHGFRYTRGLKDAQPRLNFSLFGYRQGQMLLLDDKGNMAMSFAADGRATGYWNGANSPKEDTTGTLHYATESEFTALCSTKSGNSS